MTTPTKAYIVLVEPPGAGKGVPSLSSVEGDAKRGGLGRVSFMFNPETYTVTKKAKWVPRKATANEGAPDADFVGAEGSELTLKMLLDHSGEEEPKITTIVDQLFRALAPTSKSLDAKVPQPPWVVFGWGKRIPFVGRMESVAVEYRLFRPDGNPVRAMCDLTMSEMPTDPMPKQNPTSGGVEVQRQHTVVAGDSLPHLAQATYGDPARWRTIADVNGLDDPTRLVPGQVLLLPAGASLPAEVPA